MAHPMPDIFNPPAMISWSIQFALETLFSDWFLKVLIFPGFLQIGIAVYLFIWVERKLMADIQMRVGPLYCGRYVGILQNLADFVKMLFKEPIIPEKSDKFFFQAAPLLAVLVAHAPFAVIPFSEYFVIANTDIGLLFVLAIMGMFPIVALVTGWASNSKFPFIGSLRALFQHVAYEIPLWLSALGVVMISGTLNLVQIVKAQSNAWFIFLQPIGFAVFLVAALAELERIPFDLPEAEPELVMGWMTEYSGINFGILMMSLYVNVYAISALITTLFLGGWLGPGFLPPVAWFLFKTTLVVMFFIVVRAVFPRLRMDFLLRIGWTGLLGLSILNIFATVALIQLRILPF